jgi:hypothetical protein
LLFLPIGLITPFSRLNAAQQSEKLFQKPPNREIQSVMAPVP